jgi:hypothetical protein
MIQTGPFFFLLGLHVPELSKPSAPAHVQR